jgi:hypothetical protein
MTPSGALSILHPLFPRSLQVHLPVPLTDNERSYLRMLEFAYVDGTLDWREDQQVRQRGRADSFGSCPF